MVDESFVEKLKEFQNKWQLKWEESKIFESEPNEKPKFFLNFCYPYINAYQHIGHLFTLMRVEALARYKRMQGYNVLFPQGWHATGSPIVNAAKRVKAKEEKQISIMKSMGFSDKEIEKFEDPKHWVDFFAPEFEKDYKSLGMSVDWRRKFVTTSLNPYYDKFIEWQFRKLKEKNLVIKGRFPVVWDPVDECSVGDHGRIQGEGETPQEFCLFKFKLEDNSNIITATLRPDTVMGITNVYVNPEETYIKIEVDINDAKEIWIVGKPIVKKLEYQDYKIKEIEDISGKNLIGKKVESFSGEKIPVLPASFLDINYGTGMVHSVPSDSADDYIALKNFQENDELIEEYKLDKTEIKNLKPIAIFDTPEIGSMPAEFFIKKYNVKSQNERENLEKIKKELYKLTFNTSKFNALYSKNFSKYLCGTLVKDGQEIIKKDLLKKQAIHIYYELTGKVVSRSLTECVVKIVDDQWFIDYGNEDWKNLTYKCLNNLKLYPEKSRDQFNYVIGWLHEWACTRKEGLGTKLPWDKEWLIESLSDSTIYPAFYTISHMIQKLPLDKVDDSLFDYVFLENKEKPNVENIEEMKKSFDYYYPVDFRNSGKDLIQNHLAFYMFNHVAIFSENKWPKGIGVNGWVTVDGQKMSKSLGNMIPVRDAIEKHSSDIARITILNGGEEMDDPNWDTNFADSMVSKLKQFKDFAKENYNNKKYREDKQKIDLWFVSEINKSLKAISESMEKTLFRTAIQKLFFDMQRILKIYINRSLGNLNKYTIDYFIETQIKILTPFTPHFCEEVWHEIGKESFISNEVWPNCDTNLIDEKLNDSEIYISGIVEDIKKVKELTKKKEIENITIFVSQDWKYSMFEKINLELEKGNRDFKSILQILMSHEKIKVNGKEVTKVLPNILKKGASLSLSKTQEIEIINENKDFIEKIFNSKLTILDSEKSDVQKSKQASPSKPAILIE